MSVFATIEIQLIEENNINNSILDVINNLIQFGWLVYHGNYVSYLPIGDQDNYHWQDAKNMDFAVLQKIIIEKEVKNEPIGLIMRWQDTEIGGAFLFHSMYKLSVTLNINRQKISSLQPSDITDFQWYLERIIPALTSSFTIESFICSQL